MRRCQLVGSRVGENSASRCILLITEKHLGFFIVERLLPLGTMDSGDLMLLPSCQEGKNSNYKITLGTFLKRLKFTTSENPYNPSPLFTTEASAIGVVEIKYACQKVGTLRISRPRRVVFHEAGRRRQNSHVPGQGLSEILPASRLSRKEQRAAKYLEQSSPRSFYKASHEGFQVDLLEIKTLEKDIVLLQAETCRELEKH